MRVTYRVPRTRHEAIAPYEVHVRSGGSTRRAWVELGDPGCWSIFED